MTFRLIYLIALTVTSVLAALPPEQVAFFESRIRPVLAQECYECHSQAGKKKGGLLLDSRPGWQAGGESGASIKPGDAAGSLLLQTLRHEHEDLKMPKNGAKLTHKVLADFETWINSGAVDPRDSVPDAAELAKETDWKAVLQRRKQEWWAFQPLIETAKLPVYNANPVDAHIGAKLKERGLSPAPMADAATVLRRLHYVITGLPPTPNEMAAFSVEKLAATVDALWISPRYGEKWARHWLDWLRYAETYGSEGDPAIPYAWRYRDYVIRAFNADVAYPQMVREAIAGDLLKQPRVNRDLDINESALGISQLRLVLHGFSPVDSLDELVTFTDNQIDVVTKTFQGLTVSCARCHNHKFDPISQTDFYSLYGIFTSTHPAVVDVSVADDVAIRAEMSELKKKIRDAVGKAWLEALPKTDGEDKTDATEVRNEFKWFASGKGIAEKPSEAGEFAVAIEGAPIIARIHPRGWFSDLISTKDRAVLISPRFKCEGGSLWMRSAGAGGARARYIVQNYPRTGTIHKAKAFEAAGDAVLGWHKLDLDYWKGDEIFIQCTTAADMPAEAKVDERSWFGITDWRVTPKDAPPPETVKPAGDPRAAVAAWINGTMTDAQAELLDSQLREGRLVNDRRKIAAAEPLLARYRVLENQLPAPVRAPGVLEADATDRPLFVRGDHKQPAEIVARRFLDALDPTPYKAADSGRLHLADSIADMRRNPLTARVIVNRVWHHVFGRGIVATTDNFGKLGELPSHPELLDDLSLRFIESGGSIKQLIKLIVTSDTFRRQSLRTAPPTSDPNNLLLASFPIRRLEAEAVRDTLISLSGGLKADLYGEPVGSGTDRRSIYVSVIRNRLDEFLSAFDAPVPSSTIGRRDSTNVPAQSLALLNDVNVQRWAQEWGRRAATAEGNDTARIQRMFLESFGRAASEEEIKASLAFIQESQKAGDDLGGLLAKLRAESNGLRESIAELMKPVRDRLIHERDKEIAVVPESKMPVPYAEWDFEDGGADLKGKLPLTLGKGAKIQNGALILDGSSQAFARSAPLPDALREKTLEAWLMLDRLDQRGGGALTVQDRRGDVFDSIVFAEKENFRWMAGSNHGKRTQSFNGPVETDADQRVVHVAMVYYPAGTIVGYLDGRRYGREYESGTAAEFAAGDSEVLLGCRHGSGGGNRMLSGKILRARIYNRVLKDADIDVSHLAERTVVTDREVLGALPDADRKRVSEWQARLKALSPELNTLEEQVARLTTPTHAWESLALSLVNLKELIYLR